ncbi:restriction endonuclease subunit S [Flectobacillus roseus]|uniref:restriction endonuclease subunit S n=1 Tax=Flectobacillus roseus TaxID=502259 RepID=UPI00363D4D83
MSEIIEKPLNEIGCSFLSGFAFKSSDYSNKGIPLIKIGNIQNRVVTVDSNGDHISEELINDRTKRFLLSNNDVLIAMTGQGSVGRVGKLKLRNGDKAYLNQRVGKFLCDEVNVNKDYLYYILTTNKYQDYLFNTGAGSGQPNLSPELILKTEIPWVEYPEQTAIASILSSLDDKIDLLHRQNATLEKMAETLFRQWFVEEAKEDWKISSLSEMANFLNGLACQKFPPKNEIDKLPVLKIKELSGGITENSDWASTEIKSEYIVKNGDIIFAWSASLMVKIWDGQDCILNQHLFKVTSEHYPKWFYYLWCKYHLAEFISIAESHATTMGHIKRSDLDEAKVLIPSSNELLFMTEKVEPLIDKMSTNNIQINTLTSLRDTLLPKLMSGEVRVEY